MIDSVQGCVIKDTNCSIKYTDLLNLYNYENGRFTFEKILYKVIKKINPNAQLLHGNKTS